MAATLHFEKYPIKRNLFALDARDINGDKFEGWQQNANYSAWVDVYIQVDSYNISLNERAEAEIATYAETYSQVHIRQTWHVENVSFNEYKKQWAAFEIGLERYVLELQYKLNAARGKSVFKGLGEWYIQYGINEKHIEVREP